MAASDKENGDYEEGELPVDHPPEQESGEAEDNAPPRAHVPVRTPRPLGRPMRHPMRGPPPMHGMPPHRFMRDGPRVISPRGGLPYIRHEPPYHDEQERQQAKAEREKEELVSMLKELTRYISVQDAMRSLDTVCQDLKKSIKKLDKLLVHLKKKKSEDVSQFPDGLSFSKRIMEGLKSVNVVVGTSIGHTHDMASVLNLFRAAMNYRHDVFTTAQKQELEGWVRNTRVLKVILEEKEKERERKSDKHADKHQDSSSKSARQSEKDNGKQHPTTSTASQGAEPSKNGDQPSVREAAGGNEKKSKRSKSATSSPPRCDTDDVEAAPSKGRDASPTPETVQQPMEMDVAEQQSMQKDQETEPLNEHMQVDQQETADRPSSLAQTEKQPVQTQEVAASDISQPINELPSKPSQSQNTQHESEHTQQHGEPSATPEQQEIENEVQPMEASSLGSPPRHDEQVKETESRPAMPESPSGGSPAPVPPPPPPELPPPPEDPYPENGFDHEPADAIEQATDALAAEQQQQLAPVVSSGRGATAVRPRAVAAAAAPFKMKIVVDSTAADIQKANQPTVAEASNQLQPTQAASASETSGANDTATQAVSKVSTQAALAAARASAIIAAAAARHSQRGMSPSPTAVAPSNPFSLQISNGLQPATQLDGVVRPEPSTASLGNRSMDLDDSGNANKRGLVSNSPTSSGQGPRKRARLENGPVDSRHDHERARSRDRDSDTDTRTERASRPSPRRRRSSSRSHSSRSRSRSRLRSQSRSRLRSPSRSPEHFEESGRSRSVSRERLRGRESPQSEHDHHGPANGRLPYDDRGPRRAARDRAERDADIHGPPPQHLRNREGLSDQVRSLLHQERLVLVIDLDHTLLNSVRFSELQPEIETQLSQRLAVEASMVPDHLRELYRSERLGIWTKLRPGAREFLARAAEKFELWVYSAGTRPYADAMALLLDPEERLFEGRIIAAGGAVDGPEGASAMHNKRLLSALEALSPVAVAVDDAGAVWPMEHRIALLSCERYLFFPATRRRFGMEGRALLEINRDECPDRGMLLTMLHLLERLHGLVFLYLHHPGGPAGQLLSSPPAEPRCPPWDMRNVIHDERRKVLQGVAITFSRLFPSETDPRAHPLWRMAEAYGAQCDIQCSDKTTHVVAVAHGTEKTLWAVQQSKPVVTPAWLECCCTLWRKANEERFTLPVS